MKKVMKKITTFILDWSDAVFKARSANGVNRMY